MVVEGEKGIEIQSAKDINPRDKPIGFLFYSISGTGKTTLAAKFNVNGRVAFIDLDDGMTSVRGMDNVDYITISEHDTKHPRAYTSVMKFLPRFEEMAQKGEISALVTDSLTTFTEATLNQVMYEHGVPGGHPEFKQWGEQMRRIHSYITRLLALPIDVIFTAHEQYQKDEASGKVWALPLVTGKLAGRISLYFDEVYHLEVKDSKEGGKFMMLTRPDRWYTAKSRLGYKDAYVPTSYESIKMARGG